MNKRALVLVAICTVIGLDACGSDEGKGTDASPEGGVSEGGASTADTSSGLAASGSGATTSTATNTVSSAVDPAGGTATSTATGGDSTSASTTSFDPNQDIPPLAQNSRVYRPDGSIDCVYIQFVSNRLADQARYYERLADRMSSPVNQTLMYARAQQAQQMHTEYESLLNRSGC